MNKAQMCLWALLTPLGLLSLCPEIWEGVSRLQRLPASDSYPKPAFPLILATAGDRNHLVTFFFFFSSKLRPRAAGLPKITQDKRLWAAKISKQDVQHFLFK